MFTVTGQPRPIISEGKGTSLKKTLSNAAMSLTGAGIFTINDLKSRIFDSTNLQALHFINN